MIQGSRDVLLLHQYFKKSWKRFQRKATDTDMESNKKLNTKDRAVSLLKYLFIDNKFFRQVMQWVNPFVLK